MVYYDDADNFSIVHSNLCERCGGYLQVPIFLLNQTVFPRMCNCPKAVNHLAWECPRCHKINSPYKDSCDCLPNKNHLAPQCNGTQ